MTISEMIEKKREFGLSNEEISARSGVPVGTLQKIFSGKTTSPRAATIRALETLFASLSSPAYTGKGLFSPEDMAALSQVSGVAEHGSHYMSKKQGEYTLEDYYALPDEKRVELIDGVFYDMSAPSILHQKILGELHLQFEECAARCGQDCDVLLSPCDVRLDMGNKTMVQPDLFVVCRDYNRRERAFEGAPDLVVEILSSSTRSKDMMLKSAKYLNAGVREYWLVDSKNQVVICYDFTKEDYYPEIFPFDSSIPIHISDGKCQIDFAKINNKIRKFF